MSAMSQRSQRIHAAIRENENYDIMKRVKTDVALQDLIMKWFKEQNMAQTYKKCSRCDHIGLCTEYHGQRCRSCTRDYRRKNYAGHHPTVKRSRKKSVTWKRGTKKGSGSKRSD